MVKMTPMMQQYTEIKKQYSDAILFFRLGDFYEMFLDDALIASEILQITLTSRNKNKSEEKMCGIPYHSAENYIAKLTRAGKKVAICEQVTKPDGKGIVKREVVKVITPGTTFNDNILDKNSNNFVSTAFKGKNTIALAFADISTGEFLVTEFDNLSDFKAELLRINPSEFIFNLDIKSGDEVVNIVRSIKGINVFDYKFFEDEVEFLKKVFKVKSLSVFGIDNKEEIIKVSAFLYSYLFETQKQELSHVRKIRYYKNKNFMPLNEATISNLELFFTNRGKKEGSLIWVLDNTVSSMGGRLIRRWLMHPLLDEKNINYRLEKVDVFFQNMKLERDIRESFKNIFDIERLISRLSIGNGNARDLIALNITLLEIPRIKNLILDYENLNDISENLYVLEEITSLINQSIKDNPANGLRDGGIIEDGYNEELDELREIAFKGKDLIKNIQEREIARTGINSLKIKFNKVFGYYIEISNTNMHKVPDDYIRKQTLVNAERFITPELKKFEESVLTAEDRIKELEYELFYKIKFEVLSEIVKLQENAKSISKLDVYSSLSFLARKNNYVRPIISSEDEFDIKDARHPVIENLDHSSDFVPNDHMFNEKKRFALITGPNMGGKSTYLRQIALISLMAQIGSFVPASYARISVVDQIFTRVGASDNLSQGESTFMVEMQESAYILNNATENSLIILDEIGRGTSTYDGLSLAWAISEYLHDQINAKTLFATHYHELTDLMTKLEKAFNLNVFVSEKDSKVVFLYKVVEGAASKSYGIEVAKIAGIPAEITERAQNVLLNLENIDLKNSKSDKNQMKLFNLNEERDHKPIDNLGNKISKDLDLIDIDSITPLDALKKLDYLKKKFQKKF